MTAGATRARVPVASGRAGGDGNEFATRLRVLGVTAQREDPWLMVGKPTRAAGWKLHVSATVTGVDSLFERVLPCLARHGAHFKMVAERDAIVQLSAGNFGEAQIGKLITVYPRNDTEAVALARELIEHTRGIAGPRIATDLHLGEAVYARYGGVRPRITVDRLGEPTELIPDGSGNWVPDLRPVPFSCPQGIAIPFPTAGESEAAGQPRTRGLLAGRYFVTDVLRPRIAGSVLRAIDLRGVRGPTACVLKQARPHCSEDGLGRDYRARLRHEGAMLARLRGLAGITAVGEYFEDDDTGYLPIAYVPGQTLAELVYRLVNGRSWASVRPHSRGRLLRYAAQLVRRLRSAHARGVIHRDVAPGNVWIGEDDRVYLLDWECAHAVGSRIPAFQLGTPGYSDLSQQRRAPQRRDDWQACGRVLAFMLTGLDAAAVVHGRPHELATRLAELTELRSRALIELLAGTLADEPSGELDAAMLLGAIASTARGRMAPHQHFTSPLFTTATHESVLTEGLEKLTAACRFRLDQLQAGRGTREAETIDVHAGIAGLLYVLAAAHSTGVAQLDKTLGERAVRVLTARTPVKPDLPGLIHGRSGRALAVAAAVQAGCVPTNVALRRHLEGIFPGRLDWPDFTHGAAGQGFAALAFARRLGMPQLAGGAAACAAYLVRTQGPEGAWTLPEGAAGASGKRFTGFAHGAAGMMGFLARYSALTGNADADAAWRRAEAWLISRAVRGRAGRFQWPQSDSDLARPDWWCHGAPGIALGWLCVADAQGMAAIAEEYLQGALAAFPQKLRTDNLGQCHGLAGIGEVYLEAHRVLREEAWRDRSAEIARLLVALFRRRSPQPWHHPPYERPADADGLMIGTAGILHFLLRHQYPAIITSLPLLP